MWKIIVVVVMTVLVLGGLWLYGRLLTYSGRHANRRSVHYENEMQVRPQHPPTHRRRPPDD